MKQVLFILLVLISFQGFSQTTMETIKIDSLEVMKGNLGEMDWYEAKKACKELGDGWRLPTIKELELIYKKRKKIDKLDLDIYHYWSSTNSTFDGWAMSFNNFLELSLDQDKTSAFYVRAVRNIK